MSQLQRASFVLGLAAWLCGCGSSAGGGGGGGSVACIPGAQISCQCPGGGLGTLTCQASGLGFSACACGGGDAGDSSVSTADGSAGDSGSAEDLATAEDTGTAEDSGELDTSAQPDVPANTTWTIAKIQAVSTTTDCGKIVNTLASVTLSDVVVVSPLRFSTSKTGKEAEGVFLQTAGGGPGSGLYLTEDKDSQPDLSSAKPGSVVSLVGAVAEYFCMTGIKPKSVAASGSTVDVVATPVQVDAIGELAPTASNKTYESVLVALNGVAVSDPLVLGTDGKPHWLMVGKTAADKTLRIGAGFGLFPQTKEGKANYAKGQYVNVKGVLEYSFGVWLVTPLSITVMEK